MHIYHTNIKNVKKKRPQTEKENKKKKHNKTPDP